MPNSEHLSFCGCFLFSNTGLIQNDIVLISRRNGSSLDQSWSFVLEGSVRVVSYAQENPSPDPGPKTERATELTGFYEKRFETYFKTGWKLQSVVSNMPHNYFQKRLWVFVFLNFAEPDGRGGALSAAAAAEENNYASFDPSLRELAHYWGVCMRVSLIPFVSTPAGRSRRGKEGACMCPDILPLTAEDETGSFSTLK